MIQSFNHQSAVTADVAMCDKEMYDGFRGSTKFQWFEICMRHSKLPATKFLLRIYENAMFVMGYVMEHPNAKFSAKDLCGTDFWEPLRHAEKIAAGIAFSFLVKVKAVPMVCVSHPSSTNKRYSIDSGDSMQPFDGIRRIFLVI